MELASALGLGFAHACRPFHRSLREPRQADSVLAVKEKLASQHSVAEAALQKLLFSGRVLADSVTLGEAGIKQPIITDVDAYQELFNGFREELMADAEGSF